MNSFVDRPLKVIAPQFDSPLINIIIELEHLRKLQLSGTTPPFIFQQIKSIFHILESLESARIEGNRTTIAEYVDIRLDSVESRKDSIWELKNIERAMNYAEEQIQEGSKISHLIIRDIHKIVVDGLKVEGDKQPGSYRQNKNVAIAQSDHKPPDWTHVQGYMDELINFLNEDSEPKYDLLKIALAHHRFTWIHPFGNGNGRVVRILTYILLIKYGFQPQTGGRILNPTAVFCNSREKYYEMLSLADRGGEAALEKWCIYMLSGINEELKRVDRLTDYTYLKERVLLPSLEYCRDRNIVNDLEHKVLKVAVTEKEFKAGDLEHLMDNSRQRTYQLKKMQDSNIIAPMSDGARTYKINFIGSPLMRGIMYALTEQGFTSSLEN